MCANFSPLFPFMIDGINYRTFYIPKRLMIIYSLVLLLVDKIMSWDLRSLYSFEYGPFTNISKIVLFSKVFPLYVWTYQMSETLIKCCHTHTSVHFIILLCRVTRDYKHTDRIIFTGYYSECCVNNSSRLKTSEKRTELLKTHQCEYSYIEIRIFNIIN